MKLSEHELAEGKLTESKLTESKLTDHQVAELEHARMNGAATAIVPETRHAVGAAAKPLRVVEWTPASAAAWDAFVQQSPQGLPQHLSGWRQVLHATYGYTTGFAMAVEADPAADGEADMTPGTPKVRGVLPLFLVASPWLGRRAMTTPGGLCVADDAAADALIAYAQSFAQDHGAKSLVLHDSRQMHDSLPAQALHEARILDLQAGRDAVWQGLDRNIRRQVRMAERNGVSVEIDRAGARLGDFYTVMSRFTHQVGTPIFAPRFLENVVEAFPNGVHLAMAYHEGRPLGGYFQLVLGKRLYGAWGAALPEALPLRTVYLAYWQIMADALENGFTALDMGRSLAGSNAAKYKAQWGGVTVPVYQQAWRADSVAHKHAHAETAAPDGVSPVGTVSTMAQQDSRFRAFRRVWPRLPYRFSLWLGPLIRRHVPFG